MQDYLYPLTFDPIYIEKIWAGNFLPNAPKNTGEVLTLSENSLVSSGVLKGERLADIIQEFPNEILGHNRRELPILVKLINAGENLSVQVHPHQKCSLHKPKSELWHILDSFDDSEVSIGFKNQSETEKLIQNAGDKSILELMNKSKSNIGDNYYIPSGTVHYLGAGNLVLEIQQNSNSTFRLYDWDREARPLQIEEALNSIKKGIIQNPLPDDHLMSDWAEISEKEGTHVLNSIDNSCFVISAVSDLKVAYKDKVTLAKKGDSILIPYCINGVEISGKKWLLTSINKN